MAACSEGQRGVIADTDPQQSIAHWYAARKGVPPLPYAASVFPDALTSFAEKARGNGADFLFIDSSPNSTEDSLAVADQSDLLVIPCSPSFMGSSGAQAHREHRAALGHAGDRRPQSLSFLWR